MRIRRLLLGALAVVWAGSAGAVAIDETTMFVLPLGATTPPTVGSVDLGDAGITNMVNGTDYSLEPALGQTNFAVLAAGQPPLDEAAPDNAVLFHFTVRFTWDGTVNNNQAPGEIPDGFEPRFLLMILDDRWGSSFDDSVSVLGGFQNFLGDIADGPLLVTDEEGEDIPEDLFGDDESITKWVGFHFACPEWDCEDQEFTLTADWYLGTDITSLPNFPGTEVRRFVMGVRTYLVEVPVSEPLSLGLAGLGVAGLAVLGKRRAH